MDEETLNSLRDLEGASTEQPLEKQQEPGAPSEEAPLTMVLEQSTHDQLTVEEPVEEPLKSQLEENEESVEEMDAFKESLFGLKAEAEEEIQEEILAVEEEVSADAEELPEEAGEEWSFGDVEPLLVLRLLKKKLVQKQRMPKRLRTNGLLVTWNALVLKLLKKKLVQKQ